MRGLIAIISALLICLSCAGQGQTLSKAEKKFWQDKAKMYKKNPAVLKGEFENFQEQIKDLKTQLKESMSQAEQSGNDDLVDSLRWAIIQLEGELQSQRRTNERMQQELSTQNTAMNMGIQTGLVYRIQIGAFVLYEMKNTPENPGNFVAEKEDGFNKYLIGSFRTYDEAAAFRDELKETMGVAEPWVVPYIDGVRVTIDEANQYLESQGGTSFLNGND